MTEFALAPDTIIAHYKVGKRIGAGGMGEVFLATDLTLERPVALKVLPPSLLGDADRVRRFVQEAKSASALNHPNIVTMYEIGQAQVAAAEGADAAEGEKGNIVHYMAMEFIDGKTLRAMIYGGTSLAELLRVLAQAADGLAKAHDAGIVHRDLKPDNIMITNDGFTKIVDFGLAKLTETKGGTQQKGMTQTGMVMGTVGYMSPEQIEGGVILPPSDIFAFGCILYECAARHRPFESDLAIDTLHKIMFSEPMPVTAYLADASPRLQPLIDHCLKKKPAERPSMREVAAALRELAGISSGPTPMPAAQPHAVPSGASSTPTLAAQPAYQSAPTQRPGTLPPQPAYVPAPAQPYAPAPAQPYAQPYAPRRRRIQIGEIVGTLFKLALIAVIAGIAYVWLTMPNVSTLRETNPAAAEWTAYGEVASSMRRAVVAAIDPRFWDRRPIDPKKPQDALRAMTTPERGLYMPSRLTRAIARQVYPTPAWNPAGPARAWAVASSMERHLSRERILEIYLNLARFGESVGAREAAKRYFKKSPARLTEDEAVLLAASLVAFPFDPENPSKDVVAIRATILEELKKIKATTAPAASKSEEPEKPKEAKKRKREVVSDEAPAKVDESAAVAEDLPAEPAPTETSAESTAATETVADPPAPPPPADDGIER